MVRVGNNWEPISGSNEVVVGTTPPPPPPSDNNLWVDMTTQPPVIKVWDPAAVPPGWVPAGTSVEEVTVSPDDPYIDPATGQPLPTATTELWYDSDEPNP